MRGHVQSLPPLNVKIQADDGSILWSFQDGPTPTGIASMQYISDGTQERIVDALLAALAEAKGQLRRPLQVLNVIPNVRSAASQVDNSIPVI
jgi:hypothetical protein